eukprot:COSAG02_NODE_404_length_23022_cov_305.366008_4_plen_147_part_00
MCIDPTSAATVTRVLTYSDNTSDCTSTRVSYTPLQLLATSARLPIYLPTPPPQFPSGRTGRQSSSARSPFITWSISCSSRQPSQSAKVDPKVAFAAERTIPCTSESAKSSVGALIESGKGGGGGSLELAPVAIVFALRSLSSARPL